MPKVFLLFPLAPTYFNNSLLRKSIPPLLGNKRKAVDTQWLEASRAWERRAGTWTRA